MNSIKQNIIDRFLIPYYKYSTVHLINTVIADIEKRSWFPCSYDNTTNVLTININNDIKVDIKFIWFCTTNDKNVNDKAYTLKDFE